MAWDFSPKPWITLAVSVTVLVSRVIFSTVVWAVVLPFSALALVSLTALEVALALVTTCFKVTEALSMASEVSATLSAWVAEPLATLWMALDTSWVEAFISSVDEANCWAELATFSAKPRTWEKASCRESTSLLKTSPNLPISSLEWTSTFSAVKSPWATFSAMATTLNKGRVIWLMIKTQRTRIATIMIKPKKNKAMVRERMIPEARVSSALLRSMDIETTLSTPRRCSSYFSLRKIG